MNVGGPGTSIRVIVSSTGNVVPSARIAGDLDAAIQEDRLLGREVAREAAAVALAELGRDDQLGHVAPDRVARRGSRRCARRRG